MNVFEIKVRLHLLQDIALEDLQSKMASFIDRLLGKDEELLIYHVTNKFKEYCFNSLYPIEKDKVYRKNNIYTLIIRTINVDLANFFSNKLTSAFNRDMEAVNVELGILPKKHIDKIYSITPAILKSDDGYWRENVEVKEFERILKENLVKKYNDALNTKISEVFLLYTQFEFKNIKPIATNYKDVRILGDKVSFKIANNEVAQKLAYLSLGCGILDMNARGYGFVNYRWI